MGFWSSVAVFLGASPPLLWLFVLGRSARLFVVPLVGVPFFLQKVYRGFIASKVIFVGLAPAVDFVEERNK